MLRFRFHDKQLHLAYNGYVIYAIRDRYGEDTDVFSACLSDTHEGFSRTCEILAMMAEQGELVRRYMGHSPEKIPDAEYFRAVASMPDIVIMKTAVMETATRDMSGEVIEDEVDLGLAEINAKKKKTDPEHNISEGGLSAD